MPILADGVFRPADRLSISAFQVVATRYNLALHGFRDRAGILDKLAYQRWLDERLKLFNTFCLPSMLKQTKHPDLWLLGMDALSRDALAPVLDAIKDHPWIVPAWQNVVNGAHESYHQVFRRETLSRLGPGMTHVAMTRLDSDDALHSSFFEYGRSYAGSILQNIPDIKEFWLVFPVGADYYKNRCRMYINNINAFNTRIQPVNEFVDGDESIYSVQHAHVFLLGKRVFLPMTTEPMWIRNFHGGNLSMSSFAARPGFSISAGQRVLAQCGINLEPERASILARGPKARRSRRRLAKRIMRAIGLLKTKRVSEPSGDMC